MKIGLWVRAHAARGSEVELVLMVLLQAQALEIEATAFHFSKCLSGFVEVLSLRF